MRILITGWYGTETIGDRAILASLFMHIFSMNSKHEISIASIYPFHTLRTILEDSWIYTNVCNVPQTVLEGIRIVDSRNVQQYSRAVKECDILIIGGGPFDDMDSMHMIEFGFRMAKIKRKLTAIYGCGLNVLHKKEFVKSSFSILENADSVILRDMRSKYLLEKYGFKHMDKVQISIDPAVFFAMRYKAISNDSKANMVVVNLRDFPSIYSDNCDYTPDQINKKAFLAVEEYLKKTVPEKAVAIGMNYFVVGGDDRQILNRCKSAITTQLEVENRVLSLKETMDYYLSARCCLGMRFHAVVLQTVLNGNNYILNYTSSKNGKIPGFVEQIKGEEFYKDRIVNLQGADSTFNISDNSFNVSQDMVRDYENIFLKEMKKLMN